MKKLSGWVLVVIAMWGLTGCGLKGPLTMPQDDTTRAQAASSDN